MLVGRYQKDWSHVVKEWLGWKSCQVHKKTRLSFVPVWIGKLHRAKVLSNLHDSSWNLPVTKNTNMVDCICQHITAHLTLKCMVQDRGVDILTNRVRIIGCSSKRLFLNFVPASGYMVRLGEWSPQKKFQRYWQWNYPLPATWSFQWENGHKILLEHVTTT